MTYKRTVWLIWHYFWKNLQRKTRCTSASCRKMPWPLTSSHLNLCNYYLWGALKHTVYLNNVHSLQEKVDSIQKRTCQYLKTRCTAFHEIGIFRRCKACLEVRCYPSRPLGELDCRRKMASKFQADTGFICDKAAVMAAMLGGII